MRLLSLLLLAAPALALDMVELKNGQLIAAEQVTAADGRLRIRLYLPGKNARAEYTVPFEQVIPEFVYYAWAEQIAPGDGPGHRDLGDWARTSGLHRLALAQYELCAATDEEYAKGLPELRATLHEEAATWNFDEAWRLFEVGEVQGARLHAERVLRDFNDTGEVARTTDLLNIIGEREQFLTEQKRQEEIARRARGHRRELDRQIDRVRKADQLASEARLGARSNALRLLGWSAYAYRSAGLAFEELQLRVETEELRASLRSLLEDLAPRMMRTFLKLADARWIDGDVEGALDAVHEVLAVDPANKSAAGLRDRILDAGPATRSAPLPVAVAGYPVSVGYLARRRVLARSTQLSPIGLGLGVYRVSYVPACGR
ncbi:MAG: hypothetical protein HC813_02630 [Planctomycetes bacterium]|nr:hypothetical protein [Planctomycetota bacterium]